MSKSRKRTAARGKAASRRTPKTRKRVSSSRKKVEAEKEPLLFNKQNYYIMGAGLLLIALGMILMAGGDMPSPDVWEPERIYSFRRITLAPIVILAGLGLEIYAIFKK